MNVDIILDKAIELYPKNAYGYIMFVKVITNNYNNYIGQEKVKDLKNTFEKGYSLSSINDKKILKQEFDDYLYDLKEVENLKKIKKDIISKEFIKNVYNDTLSFINQNIPIVLSYGKNGTKIKNKYDLINGIFLFCLLIYNVINPNYLLILTIPFGIFGLITIYSFIEMNFFNEGKYKLEKETYQNIINEAKEKVNSIKQELSKINEELEFLKSQKISSIGKVPELFLQEHDELKINDEDKIANEISQAFLSGDVIKFSMLLENNTNLNTEEITNHIKQELENKNNELSDYINEKSNEKKSIQSQAILMKKVNKLDIITLVIMLIISIISIIVLFNKKICFIAFFLALVAGFISMFIYNINTGKHFKFLDTFKDNLLSSVFKASLLFDLVYYKINGSLPIIYGFIKIPIIFILVLAGFVMLASLMKYQYLLKKIRS